MRMSKIIDRVQSLRYSITANPHSVSHGVLTVQIFWLCLVTQDASCINTFKDDGKMKTFDDPSWVTKRIHNNQPSNCPWKTE